MTTIISDNLAAVKNKMAEACLQAGRDPQTSRLVAVSKFVPVERILEAYNLGQKAFGENRVQELLQKRAELPKDIEWHLIGTLQRNKAKDVVGAVSLIHSVDSLALVAEISRQALKKETEVNILLQVNVALEETKHGFSREELLNGIFEIAAAPGVKVKGLMTMAPLTDDPEKVRGVFAGLSILAEQIDLLKLDSVSMAELSMGMSDDYMVAIEEGATLVRIGSRIFGPRTLEEI